MMNKVRFSLFKETLSLETSLHRLKPRGEVVCLSSSCVGDCARENLINYTQLHLDSPGPEEARVVILPNLMFSLASGLNSRRML